MHTNHDILALGKAHRRGGPSLEKRVCCLRVVDTDRFASQRPDKQAGQVRTTSKRVDSTTVYKSLSLTMLVLLLLLQGCALCPAQRQTYDGDEARFLGGGRQRRFTGEGNTCVRPLIRSLPVLLLCSVVWALTLFPSVTMTFARKQKVSVLGLDSDNVALE